MYHAEIVCKISGRTLRIIRGDLYAISKKLMDNGFAPMYPRGGLLDPWHNKTIVAYFRNFTNETSILQQV